MPYFGIPIRNGLPIGLGSVAGFGVQQFSPADLFSAGEQGAWYDPSDFSTLFTNSAGTTPVTAVEQFVGLMLDKSKGLVLGSELVTNGTFNSDVSGWTAGSTATISWDAGRMKITNIGAAFGYSYQSFPTVIGKTYKISANISVGTAGTVYLRAGISELSFSYFGQSTTTDGVLSGVFVATATTSYVHILNNNGTNAYSLSDNISVRELPGNHATQTTSAKRPKLAARYNLLTYSEQFDNAAWVKSGVTVSGIKAVAPNGTTTADYFVQAGTTGDHVIRNAPAPAVAAVYAFSVDLKADTVRYATLSITDGAGSGANQAYLTVDTLLGLVTKTGGSAFVSSSVVNDGNGWWRFTVIGNITATINTGVYGWVSQNTTGTPTYGSYGQESFTGTVGNKCLIWGADLRPASQATGLIGPTYQRVVDAATYDTVGFLPYLEFNGLSWSMSTNSIDFTATDKMTVWAGARKLSDAVAGVLCELGPSPSTTAGSFGFNPGNYAAGTGPHWGHGSRGTAALAADQYAITPANFAAPITNVLTGTSDIAGDLSVIRVNGTQQATATGDKGSGNFSNNSLYIGQRAGTTLPFNGWLTSLIVRGAQSTQSQIEATEAWVNQRTGAF